MVIAMRFCTHSQTPCPKTSKLFSAWLLVGVGLVYFIFAFVSFACFYYAKIILGGVLMIILPAAFTFWYWITMRDMSKAYVEIDGDAIRVVDYYLGVKKERAFSFADITSGEIALGYSHRVKGYRFSVMGTRYIILKSGKKHLFKIICLPETESVFKRFLV